MPWHVGCKNYRIRTIYLSLWVTIVVLVRKKYGTNQFCIDYRKLNQVTKFDSEPMGILEDMMAQLDGKKFFTMIDLSEGTGRF
jgi:hypothetical protein